MRHPLVLGLNVLATAGAVGADAPIPQDKVRMEKRARERLEWNLRSTQGAYDKVGKRDPRWDKEAREALVLAARMFSMQTDPPVDAVDVHTAAKKAIKAGCDDPLILYLYARTSFGKNAPEPAEYTRRLLASANAMSISGYPPYRRASALLAATGARASKDEVTPEERLAIERSLDAFLDLLPASLTEDEKNEDREDGWYRNLKTAIASHRSASKDNKAAFERGDGRLAEVVSRR
jgi:hypothetical protein